MSPEERADRLFYLVHDCFGIEGEVHGPVLSVSEDRLLAILATDIRAAENEALERAAAIAFSYFDNEWPGDDLSRQVEAIAGDIRSAKHPE